MNVEKLCELKRTGEYRRLGKLFYTSHSAYLYDTGTGKVIKLDTDAQKCMECLFSENTNEQDFVEVLRSSQSVQAICDFIEKEHLLCNPEVTSFIDLSNQYSDEAFQCDQIVIELTGNCNLRCKYCIYNDYYDGNRAFNTRNIDFATAKKAIDYVRTHNTQERLSITFYGGEPLLNFNVMKQCIEYCLENISKDNLSFSFTTNLTLMTREIADYVAQVPNMSILLSIDGPEEIHNRARVNRHGAGSFQDAFRGLTYLAEAVNKYKKAVIMINAVLMPPYTAERFDKINSFFESLDFLPENTEVRATYPSEGTVPDSYFDEMEARGEMTFQEVTWTSWAKEKSNGDFCHDSRNLYSGLLKNGLTRIHNRVLRDQPTGRFYYNGCCIPGKRRLYVTTDGSFQVCERIGTAPSIGNVNSGIDVATIKQFYLSEYSKYSIPDCANCWAINLCDICYAQCYDESGFNLERKRKRCPEVKKRYIEWLQDYHELLETHPEIIEEISKIEIK